MKKKLPALCTAVLLGACATAPKTVVFDPPIMSRIVRVATPEILYRAKQCVTLASKPNPGAENACCVAQPKVYLVTYDQWTQAGCSGSTMHYYVCSFATVEAGETVYYLPDTAEDLQNQCI